MTASDANTHITRKNAKPTITPTAPSVLTGRGADCRGFAVGRDIGARGAGAGTAARGGHTSGRAGDITQPDSK